MNQDGGGSRGNNADSDSAARPQTDAPENALTHFALRLAFLEKTATGLGTLGFIWATVVLLGGFAITLDTTDFWFITIILVIEGTRIFSRSHELEWQHRVTWSNADSTQAIPPSQSSSNDEENQIRNSQSSIGTPYDCVTKNVGKLLYWLQLFSAITCIVLSLIKLIRHDFGHIEKGDTDKRNRKAALYIFYSLALAEASLFVLERVYWGWTAGFLKLLEKVNDQYKLGPEGMVSTRRFFYDAYSKSINGSVFESLRMDMVSFSVELLTSNSPNEQLIGARLLRRLSTNVTFAAMTLRKIGVDICVIERLVEMLNWRNTSEQEIRQSAAKILVQVASQQQNSLRIAQIPGAVESVASLLQSDRRSYTSSGDEITVSLSLQLVKMLVSAPGISGGNLGLEDDATDKIGGTGGVLKELLNIFFLHAATVAEKDLRNAAGDAIAMLTLESKNNCHRVLKLEAIEELVQALEDEALCINTARILRNLCIYTEDARFKDVLRIAVVVIAPTVLKAIMSASDKQQEVMTGLAFYVFKYMKPDDISDMFKDTGYSADDLATKLVQILKNQTTPSIKVPRIRRFAIELAIWMMHEVEGTIMKFRELEMDKVLVAITETTTDVENFHLFSGTVGVSRHTKSVHSLVDEALFLVAPNGSTI